MRRRPGLVAVLVVLVLLSTPVALVGVWARTTLLDTDDWLRLVEPLADDARLQGAVADRVAGGVTAALPLDDVVGLLPGTLGDDAAAGVEQRVAGVVRERSLDAVGSDGFAAAWASANRTFHGQLVGTLRGGPGAAAQVDAQGRLTLDLTGLADTVRGAVVAVGVPDRLVPHVTVVVPVLDGGTTARLQQTVGTAERAAGWAPWVAVAAAVGAVALARRRARAAAWVAGAVVLGALVVLVGVRVVRAGVLAGPAAAFLGDPAVALVADHVAAGLVTTTWWVGGAGLAVLVGAALADAVTRRPARVRGD
ncbi:hypothetical protein J1G42_06115 [Cellulomonas sp. zg-ZUI222]|uniref:Integral membrane protein n=1 Tax=Cellulomonas wangleii TaxID=2816956 RepID=A0ABX8D723_9CELL|nr:hypothetical protein [Cellulomonas wangleii]MBO0920398.1 hypothetical protein [Cellulomonas wangleii]MBO0923184.1 hypothetical protein [Cellulomonas wangleii]QVI61557.1 hypothetical protein KG103_13925 [Cellulomonas wangleii]